MVLKYSTKKSNAFILTAAGGLQSAETSSKLSRSFRDKKHFVYLLNVMPCGVMFKNNIGNIINSSLQTGIFPVSLKRAVISPFLKKNNLDSSVFNNYRPISNLPFLSNILEKPVYKQLDEYLSIYTIYCMIHTNRVSAPNQLS